MQICISKVSRSGNLLAIVHMTDQKKTDSSKDPLSPGWNQSKPVLCCPWKQKQCQCSAKHEVAMRLELLLMIENNAW